jgi:RNA polymerase sigma-70 factor (ECF subfamily)
MSDLELLKAWSSGDSVAGNALLERYFAPLHRFFVNKVDQEIDDLVQRTMLCCVQHQTKVAEARSFRAYVFRIARNELYDHLRRRVADREIDFTVSSVIDLGTSPSVRVDAEDRQQRVRQAMRGLPVDLQIALELHYWEDLSGSELAEALEIPLGTAKSRLRKAKQELERALKRAALGLTMPAPE